MALVTCASSTATAGVLDGTIMRPLSGVLTADLRLDQPSGTDFGPGTSVTIASSNGYQIKGTVDPNRTGNFLDAMHIRVLGGAGGMSKTATARSYVQPAAFARDVVNGLASDSGETLSTTTDAGFLSSNLAAWSVIGGQSVKYNLKVLLGIVAPTFNWRFLADGTLWIGSESWPQASATYDILTIDPADGSYEIGQESPFILPGTNLPGVGNVNRVLDKIENGRMRSRVWLDFGVGDRGAAAASDAMARQALAGIDFYGTYICQVVSQSTDLTTMDVSPVGARNKALLGGLSRVPVRFGAGTKIRYAPGSTVLLGWDGGNPEQPFITDGLSSDTPLAIQLAGTHPAPLFDSYQSDMNALMAVIAVIIGSSTAAGPLTGLALAYTGPPHVPPFATNADALAGLVAQLAVVNSYRSQIVSNG